MHPVLEPLPWAKRVLVLGGGDGLALREILRYKNIEHVINDKVVLVPQLQVRYEVPAQQEGFDPRIQVLKRSSLTWRSMGTR